MERLPYILDVINTAESAEFASKVFSDENLYGNERVMRVLNAASLHTSIGYFAKLTDSELKECSTKVVNLEKIVRDRPNLYINGEYATPEECAKKIDDFFTNNAESLFKLSSVMDKEGINHLMRQRFDDAGDYLTTIDYFFESESMELLGKLSNSCNADNKPFMPAQKVEFIDLITAYKMNKLDMTKMKSMADSGRVDTAELNMDLFNEIMKNTGMTEEEIAKIPVEKLVSWDIKYIHLMSKEVEEDSAVFEELLRAANLDDFDRYINDTTNRYGQSNAVTKSEFEEAGLDYDKWVNPPKSAEINLKTKDKNQEHLEQVTSQIVEDIEALRATPVKSVVDKQLSGYIKNDRFVIPSEVMNNKTKLTQFTNNIIKQLDNVWKRAEKNKDNPDRATTAKNTLTILDHLNTRLSDIDNAPETKTEKEMDITVKMWDRVPQKDLFQGNYSTCCIGMGGGNGSAMPHYLMNTSYNMIELVDNSTGKTMGNALVYFVKDENGSPAFIVDNIEINNSSKPSGEGGLKLRDAITRYAANIAKEMAGRDDIPVYMSSHYNDVPCSDLPVSSQKVSFLGDVDCDEIYMDLYNGWTDKSDFQDTVELLKLK